MTNIGTDVHPLGSHGLLRRRRLAGRGQRGDRGVRRRRFRAAWCLDAQLVEAPELEGLTPPDLVLLPRDGYLSQLAVADARTMRDLTILFVDLNEYNEQVGRTFRAVPQEVEPITANLAIANMDFFEFADSADSDGVFRGLEDPGPAS